MLEKLLKPFTSPTAGGVSTRYLTVILTTIVSVLGILKYLDNEQIEFIKTAIPSFVEALSAVITIGIAIFAAAKKSSSEKAEAVAREVDAKIPLSQDVVIKTPPGKDDIVVKAK
jgi:hypothetical protein